MDEKNDGFQKKFPDPPGLCFSANQSVVLSQSLSFWKWNFLIWLPVITIFCFFRKLVRKFSLKYGNFLMMFSFLFLVRFMSLSKLFNPKLFLKIQHCLYPNSFKYWVQFKSRVVTLRLKIKHFYTFWKSENNPKLKQKLKCFWAVLTLNTGFGSVSSIHHSDIDRPVEWM